MVRTPADTRRLTRPPRSRAARTPFSVGDVVRLRLKSQDFSYRSTLAVCGPAFSGPHGLRATPQASGRIAHLLEIFRTGRFHEEVSRHRKNAEEDRLLGRSRISWNTRE